MDQFRILLVDDIEENIYSLKMIIEDSFDLIIYTAQSAEEAMNILMNTNIDLILSDIQMPDIDGFQFAEYLKGIENTKNIPIIFITGIYDKDEYLQKGYDLGAIEYIAKPIDDKLLTAKLKTYIDLFESNKSIQNELIKKEALLLKKSKMALMGEMVGEISHELRTPLNSIIGFNNLLLEEEKDESKRKKLKIIRSSSQTLLQLINDILDSSKIDNGKIQLDIVDYDLKMQIEDITNIFILQVESKEIDFIVDIAPNVPQFIKSDSLRIQQILLNLLSNAVKFTPKNKKIFFTLTYDENTSILTFIVKDQGIGIEKSKQDTIFAKFMQAENSTSRKFGGTGLGLSISKDLATIMGGDIALISTLGEGSSFILTLPIQIAQSKKNTIILEKNKNNSVAFKQAKILLVEDDQINQLLFIALLENYDFEIEIANDGIEAIQKNNECKYDLIFMDNNMPNMDGKIATQEIIKKDTNHPPIIAFTASSEISEKEIFLEAGAVDLLSKPIEKEKLLDILIQYIGVS